MNEALPCTVATRVLVIDDEPEIGDLVCAAAENLGLACTARTSAMHLEEALDPAVTAVVVDLMMPGMDGIELVRELAQRGCRAPVVLMSGHDRSVLRSAEEVARGLGLRTAGPLQKPFRIEEVERLLDGLTGAVPQHPAAAPRRGEPLGEGELRDALAKKNIVVHYQPQVSLATGRVAGVEALVRVLHPVRGIVYPDMFIGVAEELNLIDALTNLVFDRSLREYASLPRLAGATLSLNVSACSLMDLSLPDRLARCAELSGVALSRLIVEITESALIKEFGKALDVLARLRLRGVGLSVDDFGTGYSSMAQLRRVPVTELKIDRLFVNDMLADDTALTMVEETIELAHRLNLKVVAEGVETEEQAAALAAAGCDIAQGYFYSRPVGIAELDRWVGARSTYRSPWNVRVAEECR